MRALFRKQQLDRELSAELAGHLEMHIADNLRAGMTPQEARRDALLKLGGVEQTKENYRDHRGWPLLEALLQDARFGLRMLRKNPGFTAVAVLTLALGIGANTAIFSVVDSVLLRSLPFPHPSELVYVSARSTFFDFLNLGLSLPDIADLRAGASVFAAVAAYQDSPKELSGGGMPARIESTAVSEDFFPLLGMRPLHGRTFISSDMRPGVRVAILGTALWHERFGGDPAAIGKTIMLDGQPHTVIGVMPAVSPLDFATDSAVWTPFVPSEEQLAARDNHAYALVARIKPHIRVQQAQSELATISARLAAQYPDVDKGWSIHADPLKQYLLGDASAPLTILFCAVGFVLLIACANVSNLFLSRGWARRREFAIRSAIGATRGALLRQLAVECLLLALAGGACAFFVATWTVQGLRTILPPGIPRLQEIRIDGPVVWFTLAASLLAALLSGLAPALLSTRQNLSAAIKESGAGGSSSSASHNFLRHLLVVGEVALAVILLIGATLAVRSFERLLRLDLGFRPDHLVTLKTDFPQFRFAGAEQAIGFVQQILQESRAIPGVTAASASLVFPLSDEVAETTFETQSSETDASAPDASANDPKAGQQSALANRVAPDFFRTLGIPLLAGRDFSNADAKGKSLVVIVDETLARRYFASLDVVGKRLSMWKEAGHPVWSEIVGVVGNVREVSPGAAPKPLIYAPLYQMREATGAYVVVRANNDVLHLVPAIQERIWSVDKNQPIAAIKTVDAQIAEVHAAPRSQSLLLGIFGALGFVLALVGVYGVMSYLVSLQSREIGIRMALGADHRRILRMVIVHGLKLTLSGVLLGVSSGLLLTRFMSSLLPGITVTDPLTFASVAALVTLVAVAACFIPARRATRVDPMTALRCE
jgi:putative ABC transport system permease protein